MPDLVGSPLRRLPSHGSFVCQNEDETTDMSSLTLEIPDDILDEARIPPSERVSVLKRELAVQLYAREILPKAAARRLSGMDRVAFDDLLGQRGIASPLAPADLDADLADLTAFRQTAGTAESGIP